MTQEIVDAVRDIEREKGIESGTLVEALEDALLAAYKKMPGASRHATVEIDEQGDFRVYSVELPPDIEERLIDEARERKLEELEALEDDSALIAWAAGGERLTPETITRAVDLASRPSKPLDNTDFTHPYRKKVTRVYVARALARLAGLDTGPSSYEAGG